MYASFSYIHYWVTFDIQAEKRIEFPVKFLLIFYLKIRKYLRTYQQTSVKYPNIKFHTFEEIPMFYANRRTDVAEVIGRDFATIVPESA